MKLHAEEKIALDGSGEFASVFATSDGGVIYWRVIGVGEVNERSSRQSTKQARSGRDLDLIPAHVRRFHAGRESDAFPGKQVQAGRCGRFRAAGEHPLHAYA